MNKFPGITLTGVDGKTSAREMLDLTSCQNVEIGILLSLSQKGANRYPSLDWIKRAVSLLQDRCSVHICGSAAKTKLLAGELPWIKLAGRIQLNALANEAEIRHLLQFVPAVITRNNELLDKHLPGHSLLVDGSGGRGIAPKRWIRPATNKTVGFAGGLNPDNLQRELAIISRVALLPWWVDMETGIRDNDWFEPSKAHKCVDIFMNFIETEITNYD